MTAPWRREQVWGDADLRQRRKKHLIHVLAAIVAALILVATPRLEPRDVGLPVDLDHPPECVVDTDCMLRPGFVTCCGDCDPVPPFEAMSRALLEELREDCVPLERSCEPPVCPPGTAGHEPRVACTRGACRIVE